MTFADSIYKMGEKFVFFSSTFRSLFVFLVVIETMETDAKGTQRERKRIHSTFHLKDS